MLFHAVSISAYVLLMNSPALAMNNMFLNINSIVTTTLTGPGCDNENLRPMRNTLTEDLLLRLSVSDIWTKHPSTAEPTLTSAPTLH